jgi:hypothetical protein
MKIKQLSRFTSKTEILIAAMANSTPLNSDAPLAASLSTIARSAIILKETVTGLIYTRLLFTIHQMISRSPNTGLASSVKRDMSLTFTIKNVN